MTRPLYVAAALLLLAATSPSEAARADLETSPSPTAGADLETSQSKAARADPETSQSKAAVADLETSQSKAARADHETSQSNAAGADAGTSPPLPVPTAATKTTTTAGRATASTATTTAAAGSGGGAAVTRTALHVSRSLDPAATETLSVRTRGGDVATLVVKRRSGKSAPAPRPVSVASPALNVAGVAADRSVAVRGKLTFAEPQPATAAAATLDVVPRPVQVVFGEQPAPAAKALPGRPQDSADGSSVSIRVSPVGLVFRDDPPAGARRERLVAAPLGVPAPVVVSSGQVQVAGDAQDASPDWWRRRKSVLRVGADGIPVVTGVRVPDDEADRFQTWRNARVVDNVLVPNAWDAANPTRPVSSDHSGWEPARPTPAPEAAGSTERPDDGFQPILQRVATVDRDRLLDYIGAVSRRHAAAAAHARRSDPAAATPYQQFRARLLHHPGAQTYPTAALYAAAPQQLKPPKVLSFEEGVRPPVLHYAHPELGVQPAKVVRKQHEDGEDAEDESAPSEVEVERDGDLERRRVAQPQNQGRPATRGDASAGARRGGGRQADREDADRTAGNSLALSYFADDIHSDRSPYVGGFEVADVDTVDITTSKPEEPRGSGPPQHLLADGRPQEVDAYGLASDKYVRRFPYGGYVDAGDGLHLHRFTLRGKPAYYYPVVQRVEERPFWEKVAETIREKVQTGVERMSDLTRPVVEPLVEATQKISQNLGLGSGAAGAGAGFQDKMGGVAAAAAAHPALLPALGLVAGGAALGLGAVAVGRFLDADPLRRDGADLPLEHKRALQAVAETLREPQQVVVYRPGGDETDRRHKRASGGSEGDLILVLEEAPGAPVRTRRSAAARSAPSFDYGVWSGAGGVPAAGDDAQERFLQEAWSGASSDRRAAQRVAGASGPAAWVHTPCAKRLFCEGLLAQSHDAALLMEKRMAAFLALVRGDASVTHHLNDVMAAVRRGDCAAFACSSLPGPR